MSIPPIPLKIGQSFVWTAQAVLEDNSPVDLTGTVITSDVRDASPAVIASLDVGIVSATNGQIALSCADTSGWPPGLLFCDVRVQQNGTITYSDTFRIQAIASITAPPA